MLVGSRRNRSLEKAIVLVNGSHHICNESNELEVGFRRLARSKQKDTGVGAEAPVVVLTRAIDSGERLLMEKDAEIVLAGYVGDKRHEQEVVVVGKVGFLEDRSKLKLVGRNLIVASLSRDSEFVALNLKVEHESFNA